MPNPAPPDQSLISVALESEPEGSVLVIVFIPSKTAEGKDLPRGQSQELWAEAARKELSEMFDGATEMPPAMGSWMNPETEELVSEKVVLVHSYTNPSKVQDAKNLRKLATFLHRMGRVLLQGEIVVVIDGVMHRIRKFAKEAS